MIITSSALLLGAVHDLALTSVVQIRDSSAQLRNSQSESGRPAAVRMRPPHYRSSASAVNCGVWPGASCPRSALPPGLPGLASQGFQAGVTTPALPLMREAATLHFERQSPTHLLALEGESAVLGGELEELVLLGVHAVAVNVADLASRGQRQQRLDDRVAADEGRELGVHQLHLPKRTVSTPQLVIQDLGHAP